jgi:two-component system chemotaxis response regulator CheB
LADAAETGVIPAETTVMRIAEKGDHVSNDPTPQVRRVIVVGASAGGVEALSQLVSRLPRDLPAAVLVVLHIPANAVSVMPGILRRAGQLPAVHAATREPLREGIIYIAPPDRHMLVRRGSVVTTFGPRENGHRPAVDPLFRSAADSYGKDVIGVLLTGNLDDGTAGLAAIKESGGLAIVQDPEDAVYPGMPTSAIENVKVDRVLPLEEIAPALLEFLDDAPPAMPPRRDIESMIDLEIRKTEMDPSIGIDEEVGRPSGYTCPECHGGLWEIDEGSLVRYRPCLLGGQSRCSLWELGRGRPVGGAQVAGRKRRVRRETCPARRIHGSDYSFRPVHDSGETSKGTRAHAERDTGGRTGYSRAGTRGSCP